MTDQTKGWGVAGIQLKESGDNLKTKPCCHLARSPRIKMLRAQWSNRKKGKNLHLRRVLRARNSPAPLDPLPSKKNSAGLGSCKREHRSNHISSIHFIWKLSVGKGVYSHLTITSITNSAYKL